MMSFSCRTIFYKRGFKYQLVSPICILTKIPISVPFDNGLLVAHKDGRIFIRKGYAWDGATCAIDTKTFMRGSLIHDALYQLIREGSILPEYRDAADRCLLQACKEDGMSLPRRWWVKAGLKMFGAKAASPASKRPIETAP